MKRKGFLVILTCFFILLLFAGFFLVLPLLDTPKPDPVIASPPEFGRFIASRNFRAMPPGERRTFMKQMRERGMAPEDIAETLTAGERDNFRRNMEFFKQERMKEFFDAPPEKQVTMLDEAVKDMQGRNGRKGKGNGRPDMRPADGSTPSHKKSLEGDSPESRARSLEFARRLKEHQNNRQAGNRK